MPPHASIERRSHFHRLPGAVSQHPSKAVKNRNLLTTCCMQNIGIPYRRPSLPTKTRSSSGGGLGTEALRGRLCIWYAEEVILFFPWDMVSFMASCMSRQSMFLSAARRKRCPTSITSSEDKNIVDAPQICKAEAL
jgi:hypothetical protein